AKRPDPRRARRAGADRGRGARMGGAPVMRATPTPTPVDFADVQGIVRFGYGRMTEAAYLLARVKDAAAARAWLRTAPVSNAIAVPPPPTPALQVAFSAPGLAALGVAPAIIDQFSHEFRGGMTDGSRIRRSGDVGDNAPANWEWGWDGGASPL